MPFQMPVARCLVVAVFLGTALTSIASAQDVMELDLAFKNGLLRGHGHEGKREGSLPEAQRHDTRAAQGWLKRKSTTWGAGDRGAERSMRPRLSQALIQPGVTVAAIFSTAR